MPLFLSTYINKLDRKGRVSVPAPFRAALAGQPFNGIVAYPSHRLPALEACGIDRMDQLAAALDSTDKFASAHDDVATVVFADARQLPFDSEGRVTLPPDLAAPAGIIEGCAFVGCGKSFQIWEPEAFRSYQEEARNRASRDGFVLRSDAAARQPRE
ncbi:MAG: division/cell wall cluster transcriptional repressor MraZ [Alphaproteobacteria bacterium]|nr:division/cell wall cluster transcriptional repressor MraZ [Alphaproteobacteria bacterium]